MPDTKKEINAKYKAKLKEDPDRYKKHLDYQSKIMRDRRENDPEIKKKEVMVLLMMISILYMKCL